MQNLDHMTPAELRDFYIAQGGNPNLKKHQTSIDRVLQQAERNIQRQQETKAKIVPRWLQLTQTAVAFVLTAVSVVFVFMLLIGLVIGTVLLVVAEIAAVNTGFAAVVETNSGLYSSAVVIFYLALLFIREVFKTDDKTAAYRFSLVLLWRRLQYALGLSQNWQPQTSHEKTLIQQITRAIRLLMGTILAAGILGRVYEETQRLPDETPWYSALRIIVTESSLEVFLGTFAVILMTFALLVSTHFIVFFVVQVFKENTGGIKTGLVNFTEVSPDDIRQTAVATYWRTEIMKLLQNSDEQTNS